jgi:hypothetical protein
MVLPNKDIWTAIKNEVGGSNVSHHIKPQFGHKNVMY